MQEAGLILYSCLVPLEGIQDVFMETVIRLYIRSMVATWPLPFIVKLLGPCFSVINHADASAPLLSGSVRTSPSSPCCLRPPPSCEPKGNGVTREDRNRERDRRDGWRGNRDDSRNER